MIWVKILHIQLLVNSKEENNMQRDSEIKEIFGLDNLDEINKGGKKNKEKIKLTLTKKKHMTDVSWELWLVDDDVMWNMIGYLDKKVQSAQ